MRNKFANNIEHETNWLYLGVFINLKNQVGKHF